MHISLIQQNADFHERCAKKTKLLTTNYKLLTIDILNIITKLNSCSN